MSGLGYQRSWAAVVAASLAFSAVAFSDALPISADEIAAKGEVDIDSVVGLLELLVQVDPDSAAESLAVLEAEDGSSEAAIAMMRKSIEIGGACAEQVKNDL